MPRIHVIGGPGSGKTTLARRLALVYGAPLVELDAVGYERGAGAKRLLVDKLEDVGTVADQPSWVTEGVFLWWTDALLHHADVIVWLDPAWRVAAWRLLLRHARASRAGTNRHPGLRRLFVFLRETRAYYCGAAIDPASLDDDGAVTRAGAERALLPFGAKVIRLYRTRDVDTIVSRWLDAP